MFTLRIAASSLDEAVFQAQAILIDGKCGSKTYRIALRAVEVKAANYKDMELLPVYILDVHPMMD